MSKDKEESRNIPPAQDLNKENAEKNHIAGVKSGDLSATSPVAKNEIKKHHDTDIGHPSGSGTTKPKDDNNVQEWSPIHSGNGTIKPKDDKNVEGPRAMNGAFTIDEMVVAKNKVKDEKNVVNAPNSDDDETEFVDIVSIDENENNRGLTAAQVLRAQLEAEEKRWNDQRASRQRQAQLDAEECCRRNDQRPERQRQTSSSSSNDIESCDENSINPTLD